MINPGISLTCNTPYIFSDDETVLVFWEQDYLNDPTHPYHPRSEVEEEPKATEISVSNTEHVHIEGEPTKGKKTRPEQETSKE